MSEVEREIIDCGFGERREVRAMEKGMSLISRDLQGETQGAISFGVRNVHVSVTKIEVGCSWWLGFEVEEEGADCEGCVETGPV